MAVTPFAKCLTPCNRWWQLAAIKLHALQLAGLEVMTAAPGSKWGTAANAEQHELQKPRKGSIASASKDMFCTSVVRR